MGKASKPKYVDAIVIGAGLVGLFAAYYLWEKGIKHIAVLEKGQAGGIASPRAGGLLRKHYNHPLLVEMAIHGNKQYASFREDFGYDIGYNQNGYLLAVDENKALSLEQNIAMQRGLGVEVELLSRTQLRDQFQEFRNLGEDALVAYEKDSAFVQASVTSMSMIEVVKRHGISVFEDTPAAEIELKNGNIYAVHTPKGEWRTDIVVNCAGAWGGIVGRMVGLELPLEVKRLLQIVEVRHNAVNSHTLTSLSHDKGDLYARPNGCSRILIGGRIYLDEPVQPDEVNLLVDRAKAEQLYQNYQAMTSLELKQITAGWVGIDGDTSDYQPIIGPVDKVGGYYTATGFSAHGFKLAPIAGLLVAEHIASGRYTTLDANPLNLNRFAKGELFSKGYKQMGA